MSTRCFLIAATDRAYRVLRRLTFAATAACPLYAGGHDASAEIEPGPLELADGFIRALDWPYNDPRWPTQCACGYAFQQDDLWQCNQHPIYIGPYGQEYSIHPSLPELSAPPGALWEAPWFADMWHGSDGRCYVVRLPDGTDWVVDGPATSGGGWTRTGTPPHITARPSILSSRYHGWLTDGVLSDDLEGRTYDPR